MLLAGRDEQRLAAAGKSLPYGVSTLSFDATALDTHEALIDEAFAGGPVDLVISAAGVLIPQEVLDADPRQAGLLIETNFTGHVTTLLAAAQRMRRQGRGTIVVLSSVAAVRPRKANFVYGAAKAGLDAFAAGWRTRCTAAGCGCCWSGPVSSRADDRGNGLGAAGQHARRSGHRSRRRPAERSQPGLGAARARPDGRGAAGGPPSAVAPDAALTQRPRRSAAGGG